MAQSACTRVKYCFRSTSSIGNAVANAALHATNGTILYGTFGHATAS